VKGRKFDFMNGKKKVTVIEPKQKDEMIRVAGYARVSSEDQLCSFHSQVEFYNEKIKYMPNTKLVEVYVDEGITGTRMDKRTGFMRMINDCHLGKIDRIITKSINRFGRNIVEALSVIRELKALDVSIYFELENIDTAKSGSEVMLSIYSMMAEHESRTISENCRWGFRKRAKEGIYNQCTLPYGYIRNSNMEIIAYEKHAKIVRMIFDMYVNLNYSIRYIWKHLNENNIGNRSWSLNGIKKILHNERYCGDMLLQKTYTDGFPYVKHENKGELEQYYVYDVFPAIINRELYRNSVTKLEYNKQKYAKNNTSRKVYPFTGIIKCTECGSHFRRRKKEKTVWWCCSNFIENSRGCPVMSVKDEEIKEAFLSIYFRLKENIFMLSEYGKNIKDFSINSSVLDRISELEKELFNFEKDKEDLYLLYKDKKIDYDEFISRLNELKLHKSTIELQIEKYSSNEEKNEIILENDRIIATLQMTQMEKEFDESIFNMLVNEIHISQNVIIFCLKNELEITVARS